MSAASAQRNYPIRPVGVIEALGQIATTELFVSGWARAEIAEDIPVTIIGRDRVIAGELTAVRADRPDVGPRSGFCGVVRTLVPIEVADVGGVRFATGETLECYHQLVTHGTEQCIEILGKALVGHPTTEARTIALIAQRYWGRETLSTSPLPVRMGVDDCVLLPGSLAFVRGWFVDPERLCRRIDVAANDWANRIDDAWLAQARPDVSTMLADDARFAGYDRRGDLCGFIAFAEVVSDHPEDLHLAITIVEGPLLYRPLRPRYGDTGALLRSILCSTDPDAPGADQMIGRLAPVLSVAKATLPELVDVEKVAPAPITLVLSCLGDADELLMTLTTLAADAELADCAIVVAGPREAIDGHAVRLHQHAELLGLQLALARARNVDDDFDALLIGASAAQSDLVCLLPAGVAPRKKGWVGRMLAERGQEPGAAVFSLAALRGASEGRAVVETPAACLLERSYIPEAIPRGVILSIAVKWDAFVAGLRVRGAAVTEMAEPLFVAAPPAITPADRLLRRADEAARKLRAS